MELWSLSGLKLKMLMGDVLDSSTRIPVRRLDSGGHESRIVEIELKVGPFQIFLHRPYGNRVSKSNSYN